MIFGLFKLNKLGLIMAMLLCGLNVVTMFIEMVFVTTNLFVCGVFFDFTIICYLKKHLGVSYYSGLYYKKFTFYFYLISCVLIFCVNIYGLYWKLHTLFIEWT